MRKLFLLLLCCSFWFGCNGEETVSTEPVTPVTEQQEFRLEGIWGGYFPGSSAQNPSAGLELNFERRSRGGFVLRGDRDLTASNIQLVREGNKVTVTLDAGDPDISVFTGSFVDADTLQGTFQNASRGEDLELTLKHSTAADLPDLRQDEIQAAAQTPYLTTRFDVIANGITYSFYYGLGNNSTPGLWGTVEGSPPMGGLNAGSTEVAQLIFFPKTLVFDLLPEVSLSFPAYIEFQVEDFAQVNTDAAVSSPQGKGSYVLDSSGLEQPVTSAQARYVATPQLFDRADWATSFNNPDTQTIVILRRLYRVPFNTFQLLQHRLF